ncbi:C40 family peptidase [Ideonella alba]|uniref:C40 family peptidase n=1 Tax=Ideonella alba TaxID=2824118 RepID=A0A940YF24_9BURK|nr:C40 family peptidase [Ideonella alba]
MDVTPRATGRARRLFTATALGLALLTGETATWANPDSAAPKGGDAVMRLLEEKGVVPAAAAPSSAPTLLSQVRDKASDLVLTAMNFIGVRYRRGGGTEDQGFDCSGFTRYVFENSVGLVLPRRAAEQAASPGLVSIPMEDLKPGDLVFFNTMRRAFSHVGIYVGDGKFIHSPRTGEQVRVEDMRIAYWSQRFNGARRAPQTTEPLRTPQ